MRTTRAGAVVLVASAVPHASAVEGELRAEVDLVDLVERLVHVVDFGGAVNPMRGRFRPSPPQG